MTALNRCPACHTPFSEKAWLRLAQRVRFGDQRATWVCPTCTHGQTEADTPELSAAYRSRVYDDHPDAVPVETADGHYASASEAALSRRLRAIHSLIGELGTPTPRVLHVGCRDGRLLSMLQRARSVDATGIEPWHAWVEDSDRRGVHVHHGTLEEFCDGTFDLVLDYHVLEHLPDPVAHLSRISEALRPEGVAVVEVPNLLRSHGTLEEDFLEPHHLQVFTPRSLATMCLRAGLQPFHVEPHGDLGMWCRRAPRREHVVRGPDATEVVGNALANDLRVTLKRGLAKHGLSAGLIETAADVYRRCPAAGGRADIAIELANAFERAQRLEEAGAWLERSLRDRPDPDVELVLARIEVLVGRPRDAWLRRHKLPKPAQADLQLQWQLARAARELPS